MPSQAAGLGFLILDSDRLVVEADTRDAAGPGSATLAPFS
jgi:hypothetical protein